MSAPIPKADASALPLPAPRIFGLDLLRALAISSVVGAHASAVLYAHLPPAFGLVGHGGFYGVELFFVLSGFLIGRIILRERDGFAHPANLARFYLRRWFRTLPLFWLFLMVNVALEAGLRAHRLSLAEIVSHGLFSRSFASNRLTFFSESWSLAIEEWFYLLFPAALWVALQIWRRFDRVFLSVAALFFLLSTALRVLSAGDPAATWAEWQREIVVYRFDALMTGMFAAWLARRFPVAWRRHRALAAIVGAVLLGALYATLWKFDGGQLLFGDDNFFARTFRFNLVSLGFALLLPAASCWALARENSVSSAVRKVALWSYALYLVHLPLIDLTTRFWSGGERLSGPEAFLLFAVQIAGVISVSAFLFHFFESPLTRLREVAAPAAGRWLKKSDAS